MQRGYLPERGVNRDYTPLVFHVASPSLADGAPSFTATVYFPSSSQIGHHDPRLGSANTHPTLFTFLKYTGAIALLTAPDHFCCISRFNQKNKRCNPHKHERSYINTNLRAETKTQPCRLNTHPSIWLTQASSLNQFHKECIKSLNQCVHTVCHLPLTCYLVCNCSQESVGYTFNAAWDHTYCRPT